MKARECVWIAGEKGAGWCMCMGMFRSPSHYTKLLNTRGAVSSFQKVIRNRIKDNSALNLTLITTH